MKIETLPVATLTPYARNARTHSTEQVEQIAASIREFGWTNPVLIDEAGGIIAGHGRVLAARNVGIAEVPCIRLVGLSETQKRAYVIADNQRALNSVWDQEMLAMEMEGLRLAAFDMDITGFSAQEGDMLAAMAAATAMLDRSNPAGGQTCARPVCPRCGEEL